MAAILPGAKPPSPAKPASRPTTIEPRVKARPTGSGDPLADRVSKLRQIRESLAHVQDLDRAVSAVPAAPVRRWLYGRLGIEGARYLKPDAGLGANATADDSDKDRGPRPLSIFAGLVVGLLVAAGLVAVWFRNDLAPPPVMAVVKAAPAVKAPRLPVAEELPALPAALQPQSVWLVEKGDGWEQYSNGLRIDTSFAVAGDPRRYRVFSRADGAMGPVAAAPVGILFHTSESDIWPLEEGNNEKLRHSSQSLLKFLQRNHSYHYLIDRFGRVFRVVEETDRANHAGYSVWAVDDRVYMNLNSAFIGVSFETRWEGGHALPITKAQLSAGRDLTDLLRNRYKIGPEMCVTHGLTSVNPKKHLIGHHVDWARGFPFEAFGLFDQYAVPPPTVTLFGFGRDELFASQVGEPWKGVQDAEQALEREARDKGRSPDELRREKHELYDQWIAAQAEDEQEATTAAAAGASTKKKARGQT